VSRVKRNRGLGRLQLKGPSCDPAVFLRLSARIEGARSESRRASHGDLRFQRKYVVKRVRMFGRSQLSWATSSVMNALSSLSDANGSFVQAVQCDEPVCEQITEMAWHSAGLLPVLVKAEMLKLPDHCVVPAAGIFPRCRGDFALLVGEICSFLPENSSAASKVATQLAQSKGMVLFML
jgi:hypothetical protein